MIALPLLALLIILLLLSESGRRSSSPSLSAAQTATPSVSHLSVTGVSDGASASPSSLSSPSQNPFTYPGADVLGYSQNQLTLTSDDSPDTIWAFYKNKIDAQNYSSKNFIQTNSNGFVSDKLTGQKDGSYVTVDIEKNPNEKASKITITTT